MPDDRWSDEDSDSSSSSSGSSSDSDSNEQQVPPKRRTSERGVALPAFASQTSFADAVLLALALSADRHTTAMVEKSLSGEYVAKDGIKHTYAHNRSKLRALCDDLTKGDVKMANHTMGKLRLRVAQLAGDTSSSPVRFLAGLIKIMAWPNLLSDNKHAYTAVSDGGVVLPGEWQEVLGGGKSSAPFLRRVRGTAGTKRVTTRSMMDSVDMTHTDKQASVTITRTTPMANAMSFAIEVPSGTRIQASRAIHGVPLRAIVAKDASGGYACGVRLRNGKWRVWGRRVNQDVDERKALDLLDASNASSLVFYGK